MISRRSLLAAPALLLPERSRAQIILPSGAGSSGYLTYPAVVAAGGGFTPPMAPGLIAWYKADTIAASPVTSWADQSGNGYNLVNNNTVTWSSTGWTGTGVGSKPAVVFSGGGEAMWTSSPVVNMGSSLDASIFFVGQFLVGTGFGGSVSMGHGANNDYQDTQGFAFSGNGADNGFDIARSGNSTSAFAGIAATNYRVGVIYNSSSGFITGYLNGSAPGGGGTVVYSPTQAFGTAMNLVVGNRYSSAGTPTLGSWKGAIVEVVVYNQVLSGPNITALDGYFTGRWGT